MENSFFPTPRDEEKPADGVQPEIVSETGDSNVIVEGVPSQPTSSAEKAVDAAANWLSWIFVPLLMPLYGLWLIFGLTILKTLDASVKWELTAIFFGLDVILPMAIFWLLKRLGLVDDIALNGRKERLIPYLVSIAVLCGSAYWCRRLGFPLWASGFYYGGAAAAFVNLIVNFRWKISAHAAAMAGVVALLVRIWELGNDYGHTEMWLILSIVIWGFLCAARVWLGKHTLMQVLCGSVVGFATVYLISGL